MPHPLRWDAETDSGGFRQPLLLIRWGTATISIVLAAPQIIGGRWLVALWALLLAGYTLYRTSHPIAEVDPRTRTALLVAEALVASLAVVSTGYFDSPFAFSVLPAIAVSGFAAGFAVAIRLSAATALAIAIPMLVGSDNLATDRRTATQWAVELVLVALVTGYARRISTEAASQRAESEGQVSRLSDANDLLVRLHHVAQDLPTSLDLEGVLDAVVERVHELVDVDRVLVVLQDRADGGWRVARATGTERIDQPPFDVTPPAIARALAADGLVLIDGATAPAELLGPTATGGVYGILRARGVVVGAIAIEIDGTRVLDPADVDLVGSVIGPAALAVDNALWFSRLRTVGAAEERTRIARELHDRIGQSLAYLAFELDRVARLEADDVPVTRELVDVRHYLRSVVREVRDTLYDLRTEVSQQSSFGAVAIDFSRQVEARSGKRVHVEVHGDGRPAPAQERELWRIAQEAIVNAERHSDTEVIDVRWFCDAEQVIVEVRDTGRGMPSTVDLASGVSTTGTESFGIVGMRERAASIGANLQIDTVPDGGVTVRATLPLQVAA